MLPVTSNDIHSPFPERDRPVSVDAAACAAKNAASENKNVKLKMKNEKKETFLRF
jgi:hypothetical protein